MIASAHKPVAIGLTAIGLALFITSAAQADVLPVTNLGFNQLTNPFNPANSQKDFFTSVLPTGWSVGPSVPANNLIYVGKQGSEGFTGGSGNVYPVYTNPGFSVTVPAGTNFFQADGNPAFEDTIFTTVHGLTAGTTYTLEFQQAAGQQTGFTGDTTEQWKVFLGSGGIGVTCGGGTCTPTVPANNLEQDSTLMHNPSGHNTDWNTVILSFTPTAGDLGGDGTPGDAILTFLAWGDGGSTTNLPPTVFLEGVNTPVVPEPATLTLFGAGVFGLGYMRRRRAQRKAQA
jgi:hypothetical protein